MFNPLFNTAIIRTPTNVPHILPLPPFILTPPSATAAIASSSYPVPSVGCAEPKRDKSTKPDIAAINPEIA